MPPEEPLDSEIALRDLEECFAKLQAEESSPVAVRRLFVEFLRQTRQVCWLLRKEYKSLTGKKWRSDDFWERNAVTKVCRELRDMNEHELPLTLTMTDMRSYLLRDLMGSAAPAGRRIALRAEHVQLDPFDNEIADAAVIFPADPVTGKIRLDRRPDSQRRVQFTVAAKTPKVQAALAAAGTDDVHMLSELCHSTLTRYYAMYREQLKNDLDEKGPKP